MAETGTPWTRAMVRAMKDKVFKARLVGDPTATLKEAGVDVPDGLAIKVVENTANQMYMVLPDSSDDQLSDNELERVVAGTHNVCSDRQSGCTGPAP
jgi:Nitrile hydratase, alpha chain